jgi:hypothetical protein
MMFAHPSHNSTIAMRFLSRLLLLAFLFSSSTAAVLAQDDERSVIVQPKSISLRGSEGLSQEWGMRDLQEAILPESVVVIGGDVGFNKTSDSSSDESEDGSEDSDEGDGESRDDSSEDSDNMEDRGMRNLQEAILPESVVVIGGDVGVNEDGGEEEPEDLSEDLDSGSDDESEDESEDSGESHDESEDASSEDSDNMDDRGDLIGMNGGDGIEVLGGTWSLESNLLSSSGAAATNSMSGLPFVGLLVAFVL